MNQNQLKIITAASWILAVFLTGLSEMGWQHQPLHLLVLTIAGALLVAVIVRDRLISIATVFNLGVLEGAKQERERRAEMGSVSTLARVSRD